MITEVDEIKTLLGIEQSSEARNAQIEALIPIMWEKVFDYCNNYFSNSDVYIYSTDITFTPMADGSPATIEVDGKTLSDDGFRDKDQILILGSLLNDGVVTVKSIVTDTFTLDDKEIIQSETAEDTIYIYKVQIPKPIKYAVAKMIEKAVFNNDPGEASVKSERIGDYSVTYDSTIISEEILNILDKYRMPRFFNALQSDYKETS